MQNDELINAYAAGPELLREAVRSMTDEDLDAQPIAGKWSTRQVVSHIADFEPVYADRMKRVIVEDRPPMAGGDPDHFAARLMYESRNLETELRLIEAVRSHMVPLLRSFSEEQFNRVGIHSEDGLLSLRALLERITNHIPHHIRFIDEKRHALSGN